MRTGALKLVLAVAGLLLADSCLAVKTVGKNSGRVTATVVQREWINVSAPDGSWYDQPQALVQWGASGSPFTLELPIVVESSINAFMVSMDAPVVLVNQANSALHFKEAVVTFGNETHPRKTLSQTPESFSNGLTPTSENTYKELFQLQIAAQPPAGNIASTVGNYIGTLSLTFEPAVEAP